MNITIENQPKKTDEQKYPVILESTKETPGKLPMYAILTEPDRLFLLPDFSEIRNGGGLERLIKSGAWKISDKVIKLSNS